MTRHLQFAALAAGLGLTLAVALGFGTSFLRGQAHAGTLAVFVTSRAGDHLPATTVEIHDRSGWTAIGSATASLAPVAPGTATLRRVPVIVGTYDSLRLAGEVLTGGFRVTENRVEPLLVVIEGGRPSDLYAGSDEFNVGLNEIAGKLRPVLPFNLIDQAGQALDNSRLAGHETVLAAFHTSCRATCPIYTGLFLELSRKAPAGVQLLEVTTDPRLDTPAVLGDYAARVGAGWLFATGSEADLTEFWNQFGVKLSTVDDHASVLIVIDRHGYVRLARTGVPQVDPLPTSLRDQLSAEGRAELGRSEGWGASQVVDTLRSLGSLAARSLPGGSAAPSFSGQDLQNRSLSLAEYAGKPRVLNFWASYCTPCRAELPLLQRLTASHPGVALLLVDERDAPSVARAFLDSAGIWARSAADTSGQVGNLYGVQVLPTTVFVRADGTIEGRYLGQMDATTVATHLAAIGG